jgi:copper(I)-binding protein
MSITRTTFLRAFAAASLLGAAMAAPAQDAAVKVEGAWARASVQGQKASGAFMKLTARDNLRLVSASSPVAGVTEVHEMKMEGDVMKMRAIAGLNLPAGKTVELKPGGYHVMLLDLKAPLAKDSSVPLTLVFKDAKGAESRVQLQVPVGLAAPGATAGAMPMGSGEHKH